MLQDRASTFDLIDLLEWRVLGESYNGFEEVREWDRQVGGLLEKVSRCSRELHGLICAGKRANRLSET